MVVSPERRRRQVLALHAVIVPLALIRLFPIFTMVIYATVPDTAIYQPGIRLWPGQSLLANLAELQEATGFLRTLLNSFVVAVIYAVLSILLTSMAGWALAPYIFPGRLAITFLILGTMAMPMAKPMIAALGIILFLASWNNYLWPLLINTQQDVRGAGAGRPRVFPGFRGGDGGNAGLSEWP